MDVKTLSFFVSSTLIQTAASPCILYVQPSVNAVRACSVSIQTPATLCECSMRMINSQPLSPLLKL